MASTRAHHHAARLALLLVLALAAQLLAAAQPSPADNGPHVAGTGLVTDSCARCHRAHTAGASGLLTEPQTGLCYTCHGASASGANTDVENGVGYPEADRGGAPGALRGGGFSYALIGSAAPSGQAGHPPNPDGVVPVGEAAAVTSTHSVDSSPRTAWGNGPISAEVDYGKQIPLRCGSCHDPHGNGSYRTLREVPRESGAGKAVAIPDAGTKTYTTENFWRVEDPAAPGFLAGVSAWCATCHTRYLSSSSYAESGDAVFTELHRSDQTQQGSAGCAQCHVAHGSNAAVEEEGAGSGGVSSPERAHGPDPVPAAAGSYLLRIDGRGTCLMCHEE